MEEEYVEEVLKEVEELARDNDTNPLIGWDYLNRPYLELCSHPEFSHEAFIKITALINMNTQQLENINLYQGEK